MSHRPYHFELISLLFILSLGLLILFWEVIFLNYVQVPAEFILFDPVMQVAKPADLHRYHNDLLSDHIYQFYVWHHIAAESMQNQGKIPFWNPHFLAGQPLVANAQPALFYPPNLLLFWFKPEIVATIRVFFNILVAGLFTFLYTRTLNISYRGAVLSAISFAFSGAILVGPGHAYASCLAWLPFLMWTSEKILSQSRPYFWGIVASLGVSLSILGGHPETTFHNMLIVGLYFGARLIFLPQSMLTKFRLSLALLMALGLGFAVGAVQWIPFTNFMLDSAITSRTRSWLIDSIFYTREWGPNLSTLITLLYPNFFGNPADHTYMWPFSNYQNYLEQSMYFGLLPVALALGAIFAKRTRPIWLIILAVLALLCLLVALRVPGFEAINYLPIFDRANNTRLKWTFTFLGAVLTGFGLDSLHAYIISNRRENKAVFWIITLTCGLALTIAGLIAIGKYLIAPFIDISSESFSYHLFFRLFSWQQPRSAISVLVVLAASLSYWLFGQSGRRLWLFEWLLIGLTLMELTVMMRGFNTTLSRDLIFPSVKVTQTLQDDDDIFRILTIPPTMWPNYGAVYGLSHVGGYDLPVFRHYADLYLAQGGQGYRQIWSPDWPFG